MCSATLGATPVYLWTTAASASFSSGDRGTPGWLNTLNRVPEFPNAQDGNSISWRLRAAFTASVVMVQSPSGISQVEDLGQQQERLVRRPAVDSCEELGHLRLPAGVDLGRRHRLLRRIQVRGLDVPDQQAVVAEEEGVVV